MVWGLCKLGVNCLNDVGSVNQNRTNTEPDSKHDSGYILVIKPVYRFWFTLPWSEFLRPVCKVPGPWWI